MRRTVLLLAVLALTLAACSGAQRTSSHRPTRVAPSSLPTATSANDFSPTTVPEAALQSLRAALAAWATFPIAAARRPVVLTGDAVSDPASGFRTGDDKVAFISGAFVVPAAFPSAPRDADGYPVVTASHAFAVLRAEGRSTVGASHPPAPLVITNVRFGTSSYDTDRGVRFLPAWIFSFAGVQDPAAVLAVAPSSRFPAGTPPLFPSVGAQLGADGRHLTIAFVGSAAGSGPCTADYTVDQLASNTAVAVNVRETAQRSGTCTALGYDRQVELVLGSLLGNRVLVDAATKAAVPIT